MAPSPANDHRPASPADLRLTERQAAVLALLMQGKSNKAIGRELNLASPTVKNHVTAILRVLKVTSRTEAVLKVSRLGWKPTLGPADATTMPPPAMPDEPSIVVLPFANLSGDPSQAYFANGMVGEITIALGRIPRLFVISSSSALAYEGRATDIRQIGLELGVRYILGGNVRRNALPPDAGVLLLAGPAPALDRRGRAACAACRRQGRQRSGCSVDGGPHACRAC